MLADVPCDNMASRGPILVGNELITPKESKGEGGTDSLCYE